MTEVYFGLGSNVGNKRDYLQKAVSLLKEELNQVKVSFFYRTTPWGKTDQPDFLNICIGGQTDLAPEELLKLIKTIESKLGRTHNEKWGPREIDIDILFYGQEIINLPGLKIPHPYLAERAFVLVPLAEIAQNFNHPLLNKTIQELAAEIDSTGVKKVRNE